MKATDVLFPNQIYYCGSIEKKAAGIYMPGNDVGGPARKFKADRSSLRSQWANRVEDEAKPHCLIGEIGDASAP
jgi:hypothetical protein